MRAMRRYGWSAVFVVLALAPAASAAPPDLVAGGFTEPVDAVRDAAGGVLVADAGANRVLRVAPNGAVTTVAGTGVAGFSGDGGPATAAKLDGPRGVTALPGGGFVIADADNWRVRRVAPDGTITTIAGGGYLNWKCPATMIWLGETKATAHSADGGMIVLAEGGIFSVSTDGLVRFLGVAKEGTDIDWAQDGRLLMAGGRWDRLYALGLDGSGFEVLAGTGERGWHDDQPQFAEFDDLRGVAGISSASPAAWEAMMGDYGNGQVRGLSTHTATIGDSWDPNLLAPSHMLADPQGGLLVADPAAKKVWHYDIGVLPAPPRAATVPQGQADACRGLDTDFGTGGLAPSEEHVSSIFETSHTGFDLDPQGRAAATTVLHRDGRIGVGVRRITPSGSPDTSFGEGGTAYAPLNDEGYPVTPRGLLRRADGGYVALAAANVEGTSHARLVAVAFTADGTLDEAFGEEGVATVVANTNLLAGGIPFAEPSGGLTIVGADGEGRWRIARLTADGDLDPGFGDGGVRSYGDQAGPAPSAAVRLPDGRLLIAASSRTWPG